MPDEARMKAALQSYIDGFNTSNLSAVLGLFADDAIIEDPVGTPPIQGAQLREFYSRGSRWLMCIVTHPGQARPAVTTAGER